MLWCMHYPQGKVHSLQFEILHLFLVQYLASEEVRMMMWLVAAEEVRVMDPDSCTAGANPCNQRHTNNEGHYWAEDT